MGNLLSGIMSAVNLHRMAFHTHRNDMFCDLSRDIRLSHRYIPSWQPGISLWKATVNRKPSHHVVSFQAEQCNLSLIRMAHE